MKAGGDLPWSQVVMAANAPMMTKAALVEGRTDVGVLPTGQVVGSIDELPTVAELVGRIVEDASRTLERLTASCARPLRTDSSRAVMPGLIWPTRLPPSPAVGLRAINSLSGRNRRRSNLDHARLFDRQTPNGWPVGPPSAVVCGLPEFLVRRLLFHKFNNAIVAGCGVEVILCSARKKRAI